MPPPLSTECVPTCFCAPPFSGVLGSKLMRVLINSVGCGSSHSLPGHTSTESETVGAAPEAALDASQYVKIYVY